MNRVLSWPHTPIGPGLLESLKDLRFKSAVTDKGLIRFDLPRGPIEMRFSDARQQLAPGTPVYVWWKSGGFVCATAAEMAAEARASRRQMKELKKARLLLEKARRDRQARLAAHVDIVLPDEVDAAA